jgi:hypothetical protein
MSSHRLGSWSAIALFLIGVAYIVTLTIGVAVHGLIEPILDPILAIMEALTLLSAPAMVVLMAAVHAYASVDRKIALAFTIIFAGMTSAVHFVELTALRQLGPGRIRWPSPGTRWNYSPGTCFLALHYCSRRQYLTVTVGNAV